MKKKIKSLLNKYENNFKTSRTGSDFIFDCHKRNSNRGWSNIDSAIWIKTKKKAIISFINKRDNKSFQYPVTVALNHEEIK